MASDSSADEPIDLSRYVADHVVATSESEPPEETVSRLFGDHDPADATAAREMIAKLFGARDSEESAEVQKEMASFFGADDAGERLGGASTEGGACGAADLLRPDEETRHEIHAGDEFQYAHCIDGALIAAELLEGDPVSVRSHDPVSGDPVTFDVADDEVTVTPESAVVGMGMAETTPESADLITFGIAMASGEQRLGQYVDDPLDLFCRNFNAFEGTETYEQWAADADAVSVAVPAPVFASMIRDLVSSPAFD